MGRLGRVLGTGGLAVHPVGDIIRTNYPVWADGLYNDDVLMSALHYSIGPSVVWCIIHGKGPYLNSCPACDSPTSSLNSAVVDYDEVEV